MSIVNQDTLKKLGRVVDAIPAERPAWNPGQSKQHGIIKPMEKGPSQTFAPTLSVTRKK